MKNRKKVILRNGDSWEACKLTLTDDQIKLLNWLLNEDLIDNSKWEIQILDDADEWIEI